MKEEEREKFDSDIGMCTGAEEIAREDLRQHQQRMGITFENPDEPVAAQPGSRNEEYG